MSVVAALKRAWRNRPPDFVAQPFRAAKRPLGSPKGLRYIRRDLPLIAALTLAAANVEAHAGPPYPIVLGQIVGAYDVSIWTDPDATDDGSAAGQFWVIVRPTGAGVSLPSDTRVIVSVDPVRGGVTRQGTAKPVNGDLSRQFVALVMDHEGRYVTRASIDGPLGAADVSAEVDATYDLRPSPSTVGIYLMPFVLIGFLWTKLLLRRRQSRARRT